MDDGRGVNFVVCTASHPIKANVINGIPAEYYLRGDVGYNNRRPEKCFAEPGAAESAGFTRGR